MRFDPLLLVITDRQMLASASGWTLKEAARAAAENGAGMIQLREKDLGGTELLRLADELKEALAGSNCAFTVNDRLDVALACGAEGVHLGQEDFPLDRARAVAGDALFYGVTAGRADWAARAAAEGADYIGVGPLYATSTKADAKEPIGPQGFAEIIAHAPGVPAIAIGGIGTENLGSVMAAGAAGVAVTRAVMGASDPGRAARGLRRLLEEAV